MSLLTKAKVITTPTAYSDGFLHSVKPEIVLGEELVTNGGFDTDSDWTKGASWSIGGGVASSDGSVNSFLTQVTSTIQSGKYYLVSFTISDMTTGSLQLRFGSGASVTQSYTQNGIYSAYYLSVGTSINFYSVSGFNGSIDNVSVKEKLDADFTFTRNSSATRVGEDGYIQDVQIIGGELVQNGGFEEIGSELVTNGSFDTDSDWTKVGNTTISGGKLNIINSNGQVATQDNVWEIGKIYKVTVQCTFVSGNRIILPYDGSYIATVVSTPSSETYTYYYSPANTRLYIYSDGNGNGSIDNVSVKEVGQNWTFGTGWSIADVNGSQVAQFNGGADSAIYQISLLTNGVKYRLALDVGNRTTGSLMIRFGNVNIVDETITTNGTFTYDLVADGGYLYLRAVSGFDGYIDNISVKEVTDDTNLPRINYEGFTYAESLGDNVVVNGTFDTDSDWSKTNAVISGGVATITSTGYAYAAIVQNNVLTIGKRYKATIDVKSITGGIIIGASDTITSSGIISEYFTATQTYLEVRRDSAYATTIATIDNVSVQEVIGDLPVPYSGKGHLLLEPQRSNLITYSEDFESSDWSKTQITIDNNISISPDGNVNASRVNSAAAAQSSYAIFNSSNVSGALSYFAKDSGGRYFVVIRGPYANNDYAIFDLENGVISKNPTYSGSTAEIENYGNGWYRCILYSAQLATVNAFSTSGSGTSLTVLASGTIDIYGAQLEQNATYATSYIPTNGTAVTRLGETCSNATQSFPSEGVLYAEIAALADDGTNRSISISDGTLANRVTLFYTSSSNRIRVIVKENNITSFDEEYQVSSTLDFHKCAARYKDNDYSLWIDGVEVFTDTSGVAPSGLNELMFNKGDNVSLPFYGKTKMVATFPYLSNDEMECLTGEGYGTFQAMALANNYTVI